MSTEFYLVAVAVATIVSASRMTRLMTWDHFPPVEWLRDKYADATDGTGYTLLAYCGYCASFWITGALVLWGLFADVYTLHPASDKPFVAWWIVNGIFAASYLAAILMAHDGDDGEDD